MGGLAWKTGIRNLVLCIPVVASVAAVQATDRIKVYVTAIVQHPQLDAVRDGVVEKLKAAGYGEERLQFVYESAQGQASIAAQVARKFAGDRPDVIVAISTPSAQAVASATKDIPIIFSAVTDPVAAGLIESFKSNGAGNIAGVSDMSPVKAQLELATQLMPGLKRIGAPYNPGEANSVVLVRLLKQLGAEMGIEIIAPPANGTAFVKNATQSLVGKVDAIFVLADNTVAAASATLQQVAADHNIPVFGTAADSNFDETTLAALGFSYVRIGRQTGEMVVRVLKGENISKIDSEYAKETSVVINKKVADRLGINIPANLLNNDAVRVIN